MRAEVVHLRSAIRLHDQHSVAIAEVRSPCAVDPNALSVRSGASFPDLHLCGIGNVDDRFGGHDAIRSAPHDAFTKGKDAYAGILNVDGTFVIRPPPLTPELDAVTAGLRVEQPLAIVHPDAGFAGRLLVGRADFQRAEQGEFQPEPILLRERGHFGDQCHILRHVGRQLPGLILTGPILPEEMVVRDDQRALARLLRPLANRSEAVFYRVERDGQIDLRIGIGGDRLQFLVADQNNGALAQRKTPGTREGNEFTLVDLFLRGGLRTSSVTC